MITILGFLIALAVGLTGVGGGSFTVPVLLLVAGLPATTAVGTAFVFAGVLRLIALPFYFLGKHVHGRYLFVLLQGAVPGLLVGSYALEWLGVHAGRWMGDKASSTLLVIILGLVLMAFSGASFVPRVQNQQFARKNERWLPWLALPIGIGSGFTSAGAGALGTVLLLNYSELTPQQVVGTDIVFGLALAAIGAVIHWSLGSIDTGLLVQLLAGGIPGALVGCMLAQKAPVKQLKVVIAIVAMLAASQLVWSGSWNLAASWAAAGQNGAPGVYR
jgi:uncharacterized membrane protein YfcA